MNITDGDFELLFNLYDEAKEFISEKDKPEFATKFIYHLADYGFEVKPAAKEIADHCDYLADAMDDYLEHNDEGDEPYDDYSEDSYRDDENEDY
tara:strand:+ start:344 stop:625 length:282 start_codon:yes stop_codon:yes gene_type:complete